VLFSSFVSSHHSWYKHLPFKPVEFCVYLDPALGDAERRRRFGIWEYAEAPPQGRRFPEVYEAAKVDAFLHPLINIAVGGCLSGWKMLQKGDPALFPFSEDMRQRAGAVELAPLPAGVREAMERSVAEGHPFYDPWRQEERLDGILSAGGGGPELFAALLEHLEFRCSVGTLEAEKFARGYPDVDWPAWFRVMAYRRVRQLRGLQAAMHRVLERS
jgi:hypothetical protein